MEYFQLLFEQINVVQSDLLVAQLAEVGCYAFEEEAGALKAFASGDEMSFSSLQTFAATLGMPFTISRIGEKNWNETWEADFQPVRVYYRDTATPFAFIRAAFHSAASEFPFDLIVTPKMSFGTGHHDSTYLMVSEMGMLDLREKSVIDFGTGTGILAILAEKKGASDVLALDCDDWSISNAKENIIVNRCEKITVQKAEKIPPGALADVILANINLNIITANMPALAGALKPNGKILFSGIMLNDRKEIHSAIKMNGLHEEETVKRGDWLAIYAGN